MQQLEEPERAFGGEGEGRSRSPLSQQGLCSSSNPPVLPHSLHRDGRVLLDTIPGQCIFSSGSSMLSQGRGDPWVGNQSSQAGPGEPQEPQAGCFRLSRTDTPTLHITEGRSSGCTRPRARTLLPNHAAPEGSVARKGTALPLGGK